MKIKSGIFTIALLTVFSILVSGFASAALELKAVNVPANVQHGQGNIPIIVSLTNNGNAQTELKWTGTANLGEWTNLNTLPSTINSGAQTPVTIQVTAVLNIPKYKSGNVEANLKVVSKEGESDDIDITIPIARSASLSLNAMKELNKDQNGEIKITNTGNVALNNIELSSSGDLPVSFSSNNIALAPGAELDKIGVNVTDFANMKFGSNRITLTAKDINENVSSNSVTFTIESGFCKFGEKGDLTINDVNIESSGDDEDVWKPLDEITIDVEVENEGDNDIDDVFVELGLFDSNGKDRADDLDFDNEDEEKIEVGDLNDGDEETVTFKFTVPADFDDKGSFKLAIKTYSKDTGEDEQCSDRSSDLSDTLFEDIEIEREDDEGKLIGFDNIVVEPSEGVCGESVKVTADVFNLGDDEQDQVKINLVNSKLNVDLSREIREDMEEGDKKEVQFEFIIPQNTNDGTYTLELSAEYDYSRGTYRESSDESSDVQFKVFGCKVVGDGGVTDGKIVAIAASLESDAQSGKELVVKTVVTNLGNEADFAITASGYENWAELGGISERLVHLKASESKELNVKLNVNPDAEGEKSFMIEVRSGDKLEKREIAVNIEPGEGSGAGGFGFGDNSLIWVIGIINVILIILIIIVAARISRR